MHYEWLRFREMKSELACSLPGEHIISSSSDKALKVVDLESRRTYRLFINDLGINYLALSHDYHWLTRSDRIVWVWIFEWIHGESIAQ